jgi:hypothetical protein
MAKPTSDEVVAASEVDVAAGNGDVAASEVDVAARNRDAAVRMLQARLPARKAEKAEHSW